MLKQEKSSKMEFSKEKGGHIGLYFGKEERNTIIFQI